MADFGVRAEDYRKYRAGFPDSVFDRLAMFGVGDATQTIVDLGTGTGTLARGFARRGCTVIGVDLDARMIEQARELDIEAEVTVDYREARAEATGLPSTSVDVVAAGQCWHWFDRRKAAEEAARILRPKGVIVIAHFDWIPLPGSVVDATEKLILKHNPGWSLAGGMGIYPPWTRDLAASGFEYLETFSYDVNQPYSHAAWRGRVRACNGVGAGGMSDKKVLEFDEELARVLSRDFADEPIQAPHRVWVLIGRSPPPGAPAR